MIIIVSFESKKGENQMTKKIEAEHSGSKKQSLETIFHKSFYDEGNMPKHGEIGVAHKQVWTA